MVQIYTCNFAKKENLGVPTIFGKYYTLDKHFKHGFKLFGPLFNNLLYYYNMQFTTCFVAQMLHM